ncbi:MAG: hypothetical protein R6W75_10565 [Smithellaceae bacterium]
MLNKATKAFLLWNKFRFLKRSRKDIEALQSRKLRALVAHAYATVPYWRDFFCAHHLKPDDIVSVKDLRRIPLTSKKDLVGLARERITSDAFDPNTLTLIKTSGTTGEPFSFFADPLYQRVVSLDTLRSKMRHGLRPGDRILRIGGDETDIGRPARPFDQMFFRMARLPSKTAPAEIFRFYQAFRPHVVWSFISGLHALSLWMESQNVRPVWKPRFMICSAEVVHDFAREKVEDTFGANVVDRYSTAELGVIADECRTGSGYHLYEDSVIVEIVQAGGLPYLVGTNLDNYATPFIRYNTRDVCHPQQENRARCTCGLTTHKIQNIVGRDNDFLKSPEGRDIAPTALIYVMRPYYHAIAKFRFIQDSPESVQLVVVPRDTEALPILTKLADDVRQATCGLKPEIIRADHINPDPSGKLRIIQYCVGKDTT